MTKKFNEVYNENWAAVGKAIAPLAKDIAIGVASDLAVNKIKGKLNDETEDDVKISYTGLVLDEASRKKLLSAINVPEDWQTIAHHMTVTMGSSKDRDIVGSNGEMIVKDLGIDEELGVMAVGVNSEIPSTNEKKHITIAVNRNVGGKPFFSNKITNWKEAPEGLKDMRLTGVVEEVPLKG